MILFAEHFDGYTDTTGYRNAVNSVSANALYMVSGGRWGGGAVQNATVGAGDVRLLKASPASNMIRIAFHMFCNRAMATTSNRDMIRLTNAAGDRFWRLIGGSNVPAAAALVVGKFDDVNPPVSISYQPKRVVNDGVWHHIEIALKADPTTGSLKIKMDGIEMTELTIASGDTSDAVSGDVTTFDRILFCGANSNTSGLNGLIIDDLIVWDDSGSDFTGELTAEHRLRKVDPTANGAGGQQWTPSAGFNFACVDEAAYNSDTDYVSDTVAGHIDYYAISALSWNPVNIEAVIVESYGKVDTGTHSWRNKLKSSSTISSGVSLVADTTYRKTYDVYAADPNTSAAWTQANVEAAQFGVEFVS